MDCRRRLSTRTACVAGQVKQYEVVDGSPPNGVVMDSNTHLQLWMASRAEYDME